MAILKKIVEGNKAIHFCNFQLNAYLEFPMQVHWVTVGYVPNKTLFHKNSEIYKCERTLNGAWKWMGD